MDLPVRKKIPHTIPQWLAESSWFFITINCVPRGTNQLCRADIGDGVLAAMAHNHDQRVWHCRSCLLMPDHLHAIIAFPREPGMQTVIGNWKKFVALKYGVKWQRDFFDHRLRDHHELGEKASYIQMNPVRKGLCERVEDWIWVYRPNDRLPPRLGLGGQSPARRDRGGLYDCLAFTKRRARSDAPYLAGGAGSALPAATVVECTIGWPSPNGAHGVTRPTLRGGRNFIEQFRGFCYLKTCTTSQ